MSDASPVAPDHPLMIAWTEHKASEDFANSKKWALRAGEVPMPTDPNANAMNWDHVIDGSLWALFMAGWLAAQRAQQIASGIHASDCATHNEPAMPAGPCDCGAVLAT